MALLDKIKNQDISTTQKILSKSLALPIKSHEVRRTQRDESVRLELTFTKGQIDTLNRAKEILSHQLPGPTWADLITYLADELIKRKDPLAKESAALANRKSTITTKTEAVPSQRTHIPQSIRRLIFQRDRSCQWRSTETGEKCASRFQLQVDHRKARWAGGGNEPENLQLLCSVHYKLKYKQEVENRA